MWCRRVLYEAHLFWVSVPLTWGAAPWMDFLTQKALPWITSHAEMQQEVRFLYMSFLVFFSFSFFAALLNPLWFLFVHHSRLICCFGNTHKVINSSSYWVLFFPSVLYWNWNHWSKNIDVSSGSFCCANSCCWRQRTDAEVMKMMMMSMQCKQGKCFSKE